MLLPRDHADRFEVYAENEIRLAAGDKVRFILGGTTQDGTGRISNGRLDEIKGFDDSGNIQLKNGWTIDKDFSHLDLGELADLMCCGLIRWMEESSPRRVNLPESSQEIERIEFDKFTEK